MEKEFIINKLKEAMVNYTLVQLIFIYPNISPIFHRGYVEKVGEDSIEFVDRYDGNISLGIKFLEEVKEVKEKNERQ